MHPTALMQKPAFKAFIVLIPLLLLALMSVYKKESVSIARELFASRESQSIESFNSNTDQPRQLVLPDYGDRGIARIKVEFKTSGQESFPNIFQTADVNAGIRAEVSKGTLGLVYGIAPGGGAVAGCVISSSLKNGQWYSLEIVARNGEDLTIVFDGQTSYYKIPNLFYSTSHFLLGSGFNSERRFSGEIRNAQFEVWQTRPISYGYLAYWFLRFILFGVFVFLTIRLFGKATEKNAGLPPDAVKLPVLWHDPLLGLRGLAFLMVFLGHWFMVVFPPADIGQLIASGSRVWLFTASPWGGVWVFFTLSGYLMGKGFVAGRYEADVVGFGRFYRNRLLRILPMYYVAVVVVGVFVAPQMFRIDNPAVAFDVASVFLFDSQGVSPIGALWSVSTEMQFYLFVPFLYLLLKPAMDSKWAWVPVLVVLVTVSGSYKYWIMHTYGIPSWHQFICLPLLPNIDLFLVGMITAFLTNAALLRGFKLRYGIQLGILLTAAMYVAVSYWSAQGMLGTDDAVREQFLGIGPIVAALVTAAIIFVFETSVRGKTRESGMVQRVAWGTSTSLGLLTYALYVWHEPIINSVRKIAPPSLDFLGSASYLAFAVPMLLAVAVIFYRQVELPFDRLKHAKR